MQPFQSCCSSENKTGLKRECIKLFSSERIDALRLSSYLKLSSIVTFTVALGIYPMRIISARPMNSSSVSMQAQSESTEELDTTLAKYYEIYANRRQQAKTG
jgi:hypothetical protein